MTSKTSYDDDDAPTLSKLLLQRPEYSDARKAARLQYLYSDLSQRKASNPEGFASSMLWWESLINDVVTGGFQQNQRDVLVWHLDETFADSLRWDKAGKPTCLGTVAMHLAQPGRSSIMPLTSFMTSPKPINNFSWPRWMVSTLVGAPLWWSMSKIGIVDSDKSMPQEKAWKIASGAWVMLEALKKAADAVSADLTTKASIVDRLYTQEQFIAEYASKALPKVTLTKQDMLVLVKYLERDRRVLVTEKAIIKVVKQGEQAEITEADRGILDVKSTSQALDTQIVDLEARIAERQVKITSYVRNNQKDLALSHLRSKKALLDLLSKRTLAQENLSAVLLKIEAAESDVSILSAYQSATSSLKSLLSHPTLQRDNVENTMDSLQDALADQKEIEDIVTETGKQVSALGNDETEDEIQQELAQMQKEADEEKSKREDAEKVRKLQEADKTAPEKSKDGVSAVPSATSEKQEEPEKQALPA